VKQGLGSTYEGDYAGAIEEYERALAIDPNLSEGYYYLGRALSALGRREEALTALESAAELQPPSFPHRYLLWGEVHVARGEWTAALAALGRAATLAPWDPLPHYRMGWVLSEKLRDRESAIVHFRQALRRDPAYTPARLALGRLYAEPMVEDGQQATPALENCDEAARWLAPLLLPPDEPLAPYDSGGESTGQSVEARSARQAHTLVGDCLLRQGREEEALPHLERALALNPDSVDAHLTLAQAYVQAHRYGEAIDVYRQVLVLQPDNDQARRSLETLGWFETVDDGP
jgi:tetratricopeptide (TPR) repeat protein